MWRGADKESLGVTPLRWCCPWDKLSPLGIKEEIKVGVGALSTRGRVEEMSGGGSGCCRRGSGSGDG